MTYVGDKAIEFLTAEITETDASESSHWQKYHSNFSFKNNKFEGLQGFGGNKKPYRGLYRLFHHILQKRYRKFGRIYKDFYFVDKIAKEITSKQLRAYDLDVLRQSITLAFLMHHSSEIKTLKESTSCVIGDGFASMTSLILASGYSRKVVLVNLTKTLLVDLWYLKKWLGETKFNSTVALVTKKEDVDCAFDASENDYSIIAIQAQNHELLQQCPIDLALNMVSMQEMDPSVINAYFDDLYSIAKERKLSFYCCNREEKVLPDGTEIRFFDYPWKVTDKILADDYCPWHQNYYSIRPPFYFPYDGPVRHRLTKLDFLT